MMKRMFAHIAASWCFVVIACAAQAFAMAQSSVHESTNKPFSVNSETGWLVVHDTVVLSRTDALKLYTFIHGIEPPSELRLVDSFVDSDGWSSFKYQQYHANIPIEGAECVVHEYRGAVRFVNGKTIGSGIAPTKPTISPQQALLIALHQVPSDLYSWEHDESEQREKIVRASSAATTFPVPTLVYTRVSDTATVHAEHMVLAYRVSVMSHTPRYGYVLYVDANTGVELWRESLLSGCTPASAHTVFDGTQTICTGLIPGGTEFRLFDSSRGGGIHTREYARGILSEVTHTDTVWGSRAEGFTQAHWAAMKTFDFYADTAVGFGRFGYDNRGTIMLQEVNSTGSGLANYGGGVLFLYTGGGFYPNWGTAVDVVGHEWTHGVIDNTLSALRNGFLTETGGLNEGICDVIGDRVECYAGSEDCGEYLMFAQLMTVSAQKDYFRSLRDPSGNGKDGVDVYCGPNFTNSNRYQKAGIVGKWYYLLSEGGTVSNQHCCYPGTFTVQAISGEKVTKILYKTLAHGLLTSTADFGDARLGTICAAEMLYGRGSFEVEQVKNAWDAVGVYADHLRRFFNRWNHTNSPDTRVALFDIKVGEPGWFSSTVESDGNLTLKAGRSIQIRHQFHVQSGGEFHAYIIPPCSTRSVSGVQNKVEHAIDNGQKNQEECRPTTIILTVNPNPVVGTAHIGVEVKKSGSMCIYLVNAVGQSVRTVAQSESWPAGISPLAFDTSALPPGLYLLVATTEEETCSVPLVIR